MPKGKSLFVSKNVSPLQNLDLLSRRLALRRGYETSSKPICVLYGLGRNSRVLAARTVLSTRQCIAAAGLPLRAARPPHLSGKPPGGKPSHQAGTACNAAHSSRSSARHRSAPSSSGSASGCSCSCSWDELGCARLQPCRILRQGGPRRSGPQLMSCWQRRSGRSDGTRCAWARGGRGDGGCRGAELGAAALRGSVRTRLCGCMQHNTAGWRLSLSCYQSDRST